MKSVMKNTKQSSMKNKKHRKMKEDIRMMKSQLNEEDKKMKSIE